MNITTGFIYNRKLDFYIFIKSFEIIANKLYPKLDLNESIKILIEKVIEIVILIKKFYNN
jgi:hypothetical protein